MPLQSSTVVDDESRETGESQVSCPVGDLPCLRVRAGVCGRRPRVAAYVREQHRLREAAWPMSWLLSTEEQHLQRS